METIKETDTGEKLILIDCSNNNVSIPDSCPVTREAMMERIQAVDANGEWINSIDVFAIAYKAGGFEKLSNLWGNKRLRPIFNHFYPWLADNRQWLSKTPLPYLLNKLLRLSTKC